MTTEYAPEILGEEEDDGMIVANVEKLRESVVGRRIVSVVKGKVASEWGGSEDGLLITLDDGRQVTLANSSDCCAYTEAEEILLHIEKMQHVITGVGTTGKFTRWHIYADFGDVLELGVAWSPGNPFYYGYGFNIAVLDGAVKA